MLQDRYERQVTTHGGTVLVDKTRAKLKAELPGAVEMMGNQQAVSELQVYSLWREEKSGSKDAEC